MIYLLLEEENNLINSVITKLSSKMRDSSVVRLHRKIEESDVLKYKQPPMFDNGWFIVYDGNNNSVIKTLCSYDKNVTIVQAHTYSAGEKLMSDMVSASLSFKVIDSFNKNTFYRELKGVLRKLVNERNIRLVVCEDPIPAKKNN